MSFTRDYIINHIKSTKYPYWSLYVVRNYQRTHLCSYSGDDFAADESDEGKVAKSIQRLSDMLHSYPKGGRLSIDLRNSRSGANGTGIIGPLEFENITDEEASSQPQQALGSIPWGAPPPGYVSESTLEGRLMKLEADNEKRINDMLFKQREKELEERIQREREELEKQKKELDDDRKKYESNTAMGAEALVMAFRKILTELFPGMMDTAAATSAAPALGEATAAPADPRAMAANEIANMLYDNPKLEVKDLAAIKQLCSNAIARHEQMQQLQPQQQNEPQSKTPAQEGGEYATY